MDILVGMIALTMYLNVCTLAAWKKLQTGTTIVRTMEEVQQIIVLQHGDW